jgi:alpha-galactosidase
VQDWGYNYLKLDFLYCAALPAIRHNPLATGVQALRSGLERIRNSVGDDIFLLGCGCPLLPAVGLVDAMRIGPDVAPAWLPHPHHMPGPRRQSFAQPSAFNAIRNSITRAWMHPSFWINDPDCLLLRREASDLSAAEIRTLASVIGLTGGMLLLSDPMQALPERAWEIAASLLPPFTQAAQPRSWLGAAPPGLITLPITRPWGNMLLAGLFNWASKPQHRRVQLAALGLAPGRYHISEFWTGNYRGIISESFSQHLPAHGAAVLLIQPATEQPALLSTTWHLTQGARELTHFAFDRDQLRLEWEIALDRTTTGTMRLYLPPPLRPGTLTSSAPQAVLRPGERAGEYLIHTTIPRQATFSLQLNQPTT